MILKTNQALTNEIAPPNKFVPDVESKDFTREQTQAKTQLLQALIPLTKITTSMQQI